ncbi:phosphoribosyltransferase [Bisbaumannia pacifica]|uniref:Phosphoribosyltransferase n=1 Tax=Bisbaumannia pacifica TaxID=77098 RepID=A0A510XB65_9GAMM|nr:phosphoribosyltransferase [Halomonas pacifica]GEK48669.1 phosphoribosyltransferase [Halomonas pacifica]
MAITFADRHDAGRQLAERVAALPRGPEPIVLGLPRGGVPVAWEIAQALKAPLEVWLVRKLGLPWNPEVAMGALAEGGACYRDDAMIQALRLSEDDVQAVIATETAELERRRARYRGDTPPPPLKDRQVILVDDGLATGATLEAAVMAVRQAHPAWLVVAVPVAAPEALARLATRVDTLVCLHQPAQFRAVGQWYRRFDQTSDEEVLRLLGR